MKDTKKLINNVAFFLDKAQYTFEGSEDYLKYHVDLLYSIAEYILIKDLDGDKDEIE